jgi:hypothetical protein
LLTRRSGRSMICPDLVEAPRAVRLSYERGHVLPIPAPYPSPRAWADPNEVMTLLIQARLSRALTLPAARTRRVRATYRTRERILVSARESFACNGIDRTFH